MSIPHSYIEQEIQQRTAGFTQAVRNIFVEYTSQIQRRSLPLIQPYEDRYKQEIRNFEINVYSSVQCVCNYPFLYDQTMMGWGKCRRKQLDDLMGTTVSAITLTHEVIPLILPRMLGASPSYLNYIESGVNKLQISNHDSPTVRIFFSEIQKEICELYGDDLSRDFLLLTYPRVHEMESRLAFYQLKGAFSFNNCTFCSTCSTSASSLCEEMNTVKEDVKTVQRYLFENFRLTFYDALACVVSKVKNDSLL